MKAFFQETLQLIIDFYYFIINYFFLLWAHFPILAFTSDSNFTNLEFPNKDKNKNKNKRLSLLTIYFGEYVIHFLTWAISEKNFRLVKILVLSRLDKFNVEEESDEFKKKIQDFNVHIKSLTEKEKQVEKDSLKEHIENENSRINKCDIKLNIYAAIILAIFTITNFDYIKKISFALSPKNILPLFIIYFFINIFALIIQNIKVRSYKLSSFSDLKEELESKENYFLKQLYFNYIFMRKKADLFVSYILRIYDYVKILILLIILIYPLKNIFHLDLPSNIQRDSKVKILTIDKSKLADIYSDDSIYLAEILLDVQKKHYSKLFVLSKIIIPEQIKEKISVYNKQKIYYIIDDKLSENEIKILVEK